METININQKPFVITRKEINIVDLLFYPLNPRIYSAVVVNGEEPSQEEIEKFLCKMDHVAELKEDILYHGGLIDSLVVIHHENPNSSKYIVIEGNSRLAAYKIICRTPGVDTKFAKIPCKILPPEINDKDIFSLLGEYHINGKKDWDAYEQAYFLYRRTQETKIPISHLAKEVRKPKSEVTTMIEVIDMMIKNKDNNPHHYSHYLEYVKNSKLKKFREKNKELDNIVFKEILENKINEASSFRILGEIVNSQNEDAINKINDLLTKRCGVSETIEHIQGLGILKNDSINKKLETFRTLINSKNFTEKIEQKEYDNEFSFLFDSIFDTMKTLSKTKAKTK